MNVIISGPKNADVDYMQIRDGGVDGKWRSNLRGYRPTLYEHTDEAELKRKEKKSQEKKSRQVKGEEP